MTMQVTTTTTAAPAAASTCPASSPMILFVAALVQSIASKREAERKQRVQQGSSALSEYDYIVVGGGSSGAVLAARLSEDKSTSVLLLERGGHVPDEARVPAYTGFNLASVLSETLKAEPEPQNCNGTGCSLNVPAVLGGGSTINGMLYVRGNRYDYDQWAALTGDKGWGYDGVLPYFKKAEDNLNAPINQDTQFHGRGGPLKVSWETYRHPIIPLVGRAFEATGLKFNQDINGKSQLGNTVVQTTSAAGQRWTTYHAYLEPASKRTNLRIETFATARKVVLSSQGRSLTATGVEYQDAAGKVHVVRAKREVVLTAGALHTPQILMLSGVGPASQLKAAKIPVLKDLPVGERLMDHCDVPGVPYKCAPPLCVTDWQSRQADLGQYRHNRTGPLASFNTLHLNAFARSSLAPNATGQTGQPDLQFLFLGNAAEDCLPLDSWRFNRIFPLVSLLRPLSEGWVRLNASNPLGPPRVNLNYYGDAAGHDLKATVEGLRMGLRLRETLAPLGLTLDTSTVGDCASQGSLDSDAFLLCLARTRSSTSWHWSGTARMGSARDARAVLDSRLRVRGVAKLRVADASAIPYIPSGNTNNPTIMLAERAADLIKADRKAAAH